MNEKEKKEYLEQYKKAKEKGVPFFPDILFKDAIAALVVFIILVLLAFFVGAALEERANPADATYNPRPEWYFIFLFQLLKYFPGELEVIGVVVIPTLGILVLFFLPFLDKGPKRHFINRPIVTVVTVVVVIGIVALTVISILEAPPPAVATTGDQTAVLYVENCAGCHGASIEVSFGLNLHDIIAEGKHEGMPAWSADLTADQIDALAGFILSPEGSILFTEHCGACHEAPELIGSNPLELRAALDQGQEYEAHLDLAIPVWSEQISKEESVALLNFIVAPDGQRLFAFNCSPCHGRAIAVTYEEEELRSIISQGGLHLDMPPWQEKLTPAELETLAFYVLDPSATPTGVRLYEQHCTSCHGERIPRADDFDVALELIATGGSHETMPVWGDVLTPAQLDALVSYTLEAATAPEGIGQQLYVQYCTSCHGNFGEGGLNPARSDDIIAPISTSEYLKTRDDITLRSIISQGQPNFGMSPFGSANGGPLDDDEIDAIVAFMRSWEENPPVELPPEVQTNPISLVGIGIYNEICSQCHGADGEGFWAPPLRGPDFTEKYTDDELYDVINLGHDATGMISYGEVLTAGQIEELIFLIRQFSGEGVEPSETVVSFAGSVKPIFDAKCIFCHGTDGGWDAASYESVMNTGDNAPAVIPGDAENSLLIQKLLGTQAEGDIMPPFAPLTESEIQIITDWVTAGAPDN
jgi:mono/diheme cytochrome c family protein